MLDVECLEAGTLWVAFDEVLQEGVVFCESVFPVEGGTVTYGWRMKGAERIETFRAPLGWRTMPAQ